MNRSLETQRRYRDRKQSFIIIRLVKNDNFLNVSQVAERYIK